ncbi:MAG TPA: aminoglycoside phosphotransferase family protein [Mucilaginibacter sp.]|nr:aminoglycoside phosphotransferase family protein [Mucilaginibacter sp.]
MTDKALNEIFSAFKAEGKMVSARPFGSGHINDTYRIATDAGKHYLLQRINHFVFKDVPGLMDNIIHVTEHLRRKLSQIQGAKPEKEVLTLIAADNGLFFAKDATGNYWRVFVFLINSKSYDQVQTEKQAFEGGKAFGRFQALLADLDPNLLIDTIPQFNNIAFRLDNLDKAIEADSAHRLNKLSAEIEFVNARREVMMAVLNASRAGLLPERIIHNDTKFNNVLLDEHDHAQCVIDLDTVMPGYVAYDFGDAIRTIINNAPEDEPDLKLINLNMPLFTAYTKGYMQQAARFLIGAEVNSLIDGVLLLPYMQGVRFLTDYLNGDSYFKIHSPWHNLQRANAQFQLVRKLEEAKSTLNNIIIKHWQHEQK